MLVALLLAAFARSADSPPELLAVSGSPNVPDYQYTLSPDGDRVAGLAAAGLVVSPVAGGPEVVTPLSDRAATRGAELFWPAAGQPGWLVKHGGGFSCGGLAADGTGVVTPGPPDAADVMSDARLAPDGKTVLTVWADAAGGRRVELWPFEAGRSTRDLKRLRAVELTDAAVRNGRFAGDSSHYLSWVDGRVLATDLRTGKPAWALTPTGEGRFRWAASADGKTVVTAFADGPGPGEFAVWDGPSGRFLRSLPVPALPSGHANPADAQHSSLVPTPDGRRLAVLAYHPDGRAGGWVVEVATAAAKPLAPQPIRFSYPVRLSLSGDGRRLALRGMDATAVWDLTTGADVRPAGHRGPVTGAVLSKDGRWVVTVGADHPIRCWAADTGAERWVVGVPTRSATLGGLTPDGAGVLVNSDWLQENVRRATPRAVRLADGKPLPLPPPLDVPTADLVAFSPSGQTVATRTEEGIKLYRWPAGLPLATIPFAPLAAGDHRYAVEQVRFAAGGAELVAVVQHDKPRRAGPLGNPVRVERYEVATGKLLSATPVPAGHPVLLTAFGRLGVLSVGREPAPGGEAVADVATGAVFGRLAAPDFQVWGYQAAAVVAARPDGRRLLVGTQAGARVFDPATGEDRGAWPPLAGRATALAFSQDGRRLVTGHADGTCAVWDAERGLP